MHCGWSAKLWSNEKELTFRFGQEWQSLSWFHGSLKILGDFIHLQLFWLKERPFMAHWTLAHPRTQVRRPPVNDSKARQQWLHLKTLTHTHHILEGCFPRHVSLDITFQGTRHWPSWSTLYTVNSDRAKPSAVKSLSWSSLHSPPGNQKIHTRVIHTALE